jgi:predicted acetyltransferase
MSGPEIVGRGTGPKGVWTLTEAVTSERALLAQMVQFYLYDFSEMDHEDVDEAGRYAFPFLDRFWDKRVYPGDHPFLLRVGGKPAGFALVGERSPRQECLSCRYIYEFHVMRAYRGAGYGAAMATAVFDHFPGRWLIEEIGSNLSAQRFWRRVIADYTGGDYVERTYPADRCQLVRQEFDTRSRVMKGGE